VNEIRDLAQKFVDFLHTNPDDPTFCDFVDDHGPQEVLEVIDDRMRQVVAQKRDRQTRYLVELAHAPTVEQAESIKTNYVTWRNKALYFYQQLELARSKIKKNFPESGSNSVVTWLEKIHDALVRIECQHDHLITRLARAGHLAD
jgi:hypothetical protein